MPDNNLLSKLADPTSASVFDSLSKRIQRRIAQAITGGEFTNLAMGATQPVGQIANPSIATAAKASLPMDEASRMARAKEMGLTNRVFHGTRRDFPSFQVDSTDLAPDRALGVHLAKDPEVSNTFAGNPGGNVMDLLIPDDSKFYPLHQREYEWARNKPDIPLSRRVATDQTSVNELMASVVYRDNPRMLERYLVEARKIDPEEARKIAQDMVAGKRVTMPTDGREYTLSSFIDDFSGATPYNESDRIAFNDYARQGLQDQGYVGVKYVNTAPMETATASDPTSYIVFDPKNIRSRFAAFDPSKAGSSDLLASIVGGVGAGAMMRQSLLNMMGQRNSPEKRTP